MTPRTAPLKHGTRVAAVMTAAALMMTGAVAGLSLFESLTQTTTMAADTVIVPPPPVADPVAAPVADPVAADVLYSASGLPELPSLAAISAVADSSTLAAGPAEQPVAQPATRTAVRPAAQPAAPVRESDDHPSGDHQQQDD